MSGRSSDAHSRSKDYAADPGRPGPAIQDLAIAKAAELELETISL